jgi:DNA primase
MDVVVDIKGRLGIYEVVSQYVQLKKAGVNYKGLCPFHSEKSPSFVVSPEKQICHCFGCNKGGDIFTFIQEIEGVNFAEALQILADKAGVKISKQQLKQNAKYSSDKEQYYDIHKLAAQFYSDQLFCTEDGKRVLAYLKKRGVTEETVKEYQIGFSPDRFDFLYPKLLKEGYKKDVLVKSGLASQKEIASEEIYDKFRARLMIPIFDYLGRICGFGGRALKKEQAPKYLNSPDSVIYNKSQVLYGLFHGKQDVKEKDSVVFVEGYFDVLLPHQQGSKNVVATCGTALTAGQVRLIKRLTQKAVLCFDNDAAGFEATKRAYSVLNEQKMAVYVLDAIEGKDPADYVAKEGGDFQALQKEAKDFSKYLVAKIFEGKDLDNLADRRNIFKDLAPFFNKMNALEKDWLLKEISLRLNMAKKFVLEEFSKRKNNERQHASVKPAGQPDKVTYDLEDTFLAIVLAFPEVFSWLLDISFDKELFSKNKPIYNVLEAQYNAFAESFKSWNFDDDSLAELRGEIKVLALFAQERYQNFSLENIKEELESFISKMQKARQQDQIKNIRLNLRKAEEAGDKEKYQQLLTDLRDVWSQ